MNKADEEQEPEHINAGYIECLEHQRTPDANKQPDDITADAADARLIEGCQGTPNADKPLEDIADILLNRDKIPGNDAGKRKYYCLSGKQILIILKKATYLMYYFSTLFQILPMRKMIHFRQIIHQMTIALLTIRFLMIYQMILILK